MKQYEEYGTQIVSCTREAYDAALQEAFDGGRASTAREHAEAIKQARAAERARIVAWLRDVAEDAHTVKWAADRLAEEA